MAAVMVGKEFGQNMKIEKFLRSSPHFVVHAMRADLDSGVRRALSPHGLGYVDALVLAALFFESDKGARLADLAKAMGAKKSNLSHCLSRLEAERLIRRQLLEDDRRGFVFRLTEKGRERAMKAIKYFDGAQRRAEAKLTEKGVARLTTQLRVLADLGRDGR